MKELIAVSGNNALVECDNTLVPSVELILLMSEPRYALGPEGTVRHRDVVTVRLSANPGRLREVAAVLLSMADDADALADRWRVASK